MAVLAGIRETRRGRHRRSRHPRHREARTSADGSLRERDVVQDGTTSPEFDPLATFIGGILP